MMKLITLLSGLVFYTLAIGQSYNDTAQRFSVVQLQQDFDSLYSWLKANHPAPYAYYSRAEADVAFQVIRKQLNRPMNKLEFYRVANPFLSSFKDGHTYLFAGNRYKSLFDEYLNQGGKVFPIRIVVIDGKIYCADASMAKSRMEKGDEIIALNNRPVSTILPYLKSHCTSDDERGVFITITRSFGKKLWEGYNWGEEVQVTYKRKSKVVTETIKGINEQDYRKLMASDRPKRVLRIDTSYKIAILEINIYDDLNASKNFIDSAFYVIKQQNLKHIVLDLRNNGGGNSDIGDYVLAHISNKKQTPVVSKTIKDALVYTTWSEDSWVARMVRNARQNWTNLGNGLYREIFDAREPDSLLQPNLFIPEAKFYLFTSGYTYSSAHMTTLSVKCYQLGTIIGQPTGERLDLTGENMGMPLPHTKLFFISATAVYTSACGNGKQVGVQPDYYTPLRIEDITVGHDPELTFLKQLIREDKSLAH